MKLCGKDCVPICDFCKYFKSESMDGGDGYNGDGWCKLRNIAVEPYCECNEFECFNLK